RVRGFQGTRRWSAAVAFSRDGQEVYAGAFAWDAETGEQLSPAFLKHPQVVSVVGFSPDGKQVLTGGSDGTARLFEAASGKELHAFRGSGPARAVAFSPDGTRVLTAGADGTVRLWDGRAGTGLQRFLAYRDGPGAAAPPNP